MKEAVIVMGLGNLVFSDEGLGVHAVHHLMEHYEFPAPVELVDGATLGLILLEEVERAKKLLVIDAVNVNREPGAVVRLTGEEIPATLAAKMSLHQQGFQEVMALAQWRGQFPEELVLIGVQPERMDWGTELTAPVAEALPHVIRLVLDELKSWGVAATPKG